VNGRGGYRGNGAPRVWSNGARSIPGVVNAYNTAEVREELAQLLEHGPAGEHPPTDTLPGTMAIPRRLIDRISGFLDRIEEDHFKGRGATVPAQPKSPTSSHYGAETRENTLTWGSVQGIDFNPGAVTPFSFASTQLLQVFRPRPTAGIVLTTVSLGIGWTGENPTTFTITYHVGVGQGNQTIPIVTVVPGASLVNGSTIIVDTRQWPIQSLQVQVSASFAPANEIEHSLIVAAFFAPFVQ